MNDMSLFYKYALPVAYFLIGLEFLLSMILHRDCVSWKETLANLSMGYVGEILRRLTFLAFPVQILYWLSHKITWTWTPGWLAGIGCFVVFDFLSYWEHRFAHEYAFLWGFHNVHHSSTKYNFSTGSRQSWFVELYRDVFLIPLALLGVPFLTILACRVLHGYLQIFQHTTYIGKLGPLEYILATPSLHRVHHGTNPQYINKNYGNIFCVWDRLFKTFEPEVEPVRYGPQTNIKESFNPLVIQFIEPWRLIRGLQGIHSLRRAVRFLMGQPGKEMENAELTPLPFKKEA